MHPAPSVIVFTVLSGLGFGFLAFLSAGIVPAQGWAAFGLWGLGVGLAVAGLVSSSFHLGHPERALRAFTQWRTSWLSREACISVLTLVWLAPVGLADWLGFGWPPLWGWIGAALCLLTVLCTAMIYAQLKTVPRWNHPLTPLVFLAFSLTGGALLAGYWHGLPVLAALMLAGWHIGDGGFSARAQDMGTATGLGPLGKVRVLEQPHSHPNYVMREMIHHVGRKHAQKLRVIALALSALLPLALLLALPAHPATLAAAALAHVTGALAQRWLFFAEAEHVVGLFYGART